jgi:hypothetical protein
MRKLKEREESAFAEAIEKAASSENQIFFLPSIGLVLSNTDRCLLKKEICQGIMNNW